MDNTRPSALNNILKMFGLSNTPTVPTGDDDVVGDVDEPPETVAELKQTPFYTKSTRPSQSMRRESLLTQAITGVPKSSDPSLSELPHQPARALSTASSQSFPSTAELTSDGDLTSPARSVSPSPPFPAAQFPPMLSTRKPTLQTRVAIAPMTKDDKPETAEVGEAAVEKSLGRKRCIMFACSDASTEVSNQNSPALPPKEEPKPEPAPRKCRLTFVCPGRQDSVDSTPSPKTEKRPSDVPSPMPQALQSPSVDVGKAIPTVKKIIAEEVKSEKPASPPTFHEFGNSQDETDAWVDKPSPVRPKLTLDDCMRKENAIRRIAKEAEEEAEAEELEQEELDEDLEDEQDIEDDFAPSDDDESDGGNESDDEGGFADSDDESEDGSEYQFWAPSTATATITASAEAHTHFSLRTRSRGSSVSSAQSQTNPQPTVMRGRGKISKAIKMRPGTPELPDSTDFVCGTLDEDRPLEAAYISCREQRKREKHVLIPQDIDPSFPTTDPEDEEDEEDDLEDESGEPDWLREQFGAMDDDMRGRRPSAIKVSPLHPATTKKADHRPQITKRSTTHRSPPPPKHRSPPPPRHRSPAPKHRSPPPRRLFGHSPARMQSPPARGRLNSPRGSPTGVKMPLGITINRLAQRPGNHRTASLPHTPNPFFRNWQRGSPATSRIPSAAVTPGLDSEDSRADLHVRGPVDIVIGLEKKRQKRKEKFWRQHCRKAAKEQAERKCAPGRGVERMKELGLECAERTRGYGLGQQAQLVLSL